MAKQTVKSGKIKKIKTFAKKSQVLECFSKLSHKAVNLRAKSGVFLLKHLESDKSEQKTIEEKYTLNRIIRGLGSSNENARAGYYSVLVALLSNNKFTFDQLNESIEKNLKPSGNNPKSEYADIHMGLILSYGATIRSGVFCTFSESQQKEIIEKMLSCGKKRSYFFLAVTMFLVDLIEKDEEVHFSKIIWPVLQLEITQEWSNQNINYLHLLVILKSRFPNIIKKLLKSKLGHEDIFSVACIKPLCNVLLNIPSNNFLLNPAYARISEEIAKSDVLHEFINELDQNIIKTTRNKFLAVTIILTNVILYLKGSSQIAEMIPNNFLLHLQQYCKNVVKNNDPEVMEKANHFFNALALTIKNPEVTDNTKINCIKRLLTYPGHIFIEKNIKIKIIQQITATLSTDGIKEISEFYKNIVTAQIKKKTNKGYDSWHNAERLYASQMFARLLSHPSVRNEIEWKTEQLKFICHQGFIKDDETKNVGVELAASLRETFYHSLDLKFSKLEHLRTALAVIVRYLQSFLSQENCAEILRVSLCSEALEAWQSTIKQIQKLEEKIVKKNEPTLVVFHTLFLQMSLQLFNEQKLAATSLKELLQCYKNKKEEKKKKRKSGIEESNLEMEDINWIEVVIDLFLNLLSQNSLLLRKIVNCVFPHLCKDLTTSAVHQILAVLDPKNETNPLSNSSDTEDDEDDETEILAEDEIEEDSTDGEDIDYEDNETVNDKLRTAVRKALGDDGEQTDNESIDLNEMNENEAMEIDKALAQAFKQFKSNKGGKIKKQTKEAETLTHFRVRALDLIEIYLDSEPPLLTCLEIMIPLLNTYEFCIKDEHQKPLQDRLESCFKKLTSLKKFSSTDGVNDEVLNTLVKSLVEKGSKSTLIAQEMSDKTSKCCVFIIKCSISICEASETAQQIRKKLKKNLAQTLTDVLNSFFKEKSCITSFTLFKNVLELNWSGTLSLVSKLYDIVFDESVKPFKRSQASELLTIFYKNHRFLKAESSKIQRKLQGAEVKFSEDLIRFLQSLVDNPKQSLVREKFLTNIFNLLLSIKKGPLSNGHLNWEGVGTVLSKYRVVGSFSRDAKSVYNQLSHVLNLRKFDIKEIERNDKNIQQESDSNVENLQENGDISENENLETKIEKKKKKNHSKSKKLKKQTQFERLQSNSEGLISISFSKANAMESEILSDNGDKSTNNIVKNSTKINKSVDKLGKIKRRKSESKSATTPKKVKTKN